MRIAELWRYPVKSLRGERLDSFPVTTAGLEGDRGYALFDTETGFGLTARRHPALLFAAARLRADGSAEITLPDGSVAADDEALSVWLGRPVQLRSSAEQQDRRYENPADFEHESTGVWEPFKGSRGAFHDSGRASVSLLSRQSIGDWSALRFRANVLLDGAGEDALVGSRVLLGDAVLDVKLRLERCVMGTRPQPDGLEKDLDLLRTIHRQHYGCLAFGGVVTQPGTVRVGDVVDPL
ncbi:MOSC domain-containing protein [soil metagenome]